MYRRLNILTLLLLLFFAACDKPSTEPDLGYDYFPLELGQSRTYQVDSVVYDPNGLVLVDTIQFQMKETLADSFEDDEGQTWYRIERFERDTATAPWHFHSTIATSIDPTRAFRKENNLQFINFIFPQDIFSQWVSTVFIDPTQAVQIAGENVEMFKYWDSGFDFVHESYELGDQSYDSACRVIHADFESLIEKRYVEEVYAKGVGLVYRELYILDTQLIDGSIPWEDKGEKGFILKQSLILIE